MRIAYIILAHKLPEQLVRLVRKLNSPTATFFIHVDKKTDPDTYRRMVEPLNQFENVYFLKRYAIYYADFHHLKATLEGFQKIISTGTKFDYVMLLTGQDYPIKSNEYIEKFLQEGRRSSFIEFFQLPDERWKYEDGGLDRIHYWHFRVGGRNFAIQKENRFVPSFLKPVWGRLVSLPPIRRNLPGNLKLFFGGSAYWCLSRECVEYLNDYVQVNNSIVNFFQHVNIPEEAFFQTILQNSSLSGCLVNVNLWYIVWSNSPHPALLSKLDFESIMNSEKLFARKFDATVDEEMLDMIDRATS